MADSVSVRVPATSANLGAGFDCLGLALDLWGTITLAPGRGGREDEPMAHMALTAARRLYERAGLRPPALAARYAGDIPIARGLGASAVARVGGLVAANVLAGRPLAEDELLRLATELEGHADNVAPALFGGLQVCAVDAAGGVFRAAVPLPDGLQAVLFVPELRMPTKESRALLPDAVPRADAVHNIARAALFVAAISTRRLDLLDAATDDRLHQPARSQLFPAMYDIFRAAKEAGALCAYLSGGGSAVCALATDRAAEIAAAMESTAATAGFPGRSIVTQPTPKGALAES